MADPVDLRIYRGDDKRWSISVQQDGSPLDLTGGTLRFTAKWRYEDADGSAVIQRSSPSSGITIVSATGGTAQLSLVPANTSSLPPREVKLFYDVQFTDSTGRVFTVAQGRLVVMPDLSVTTP